MSTKFLFLCLIPAALPVFGGGHAVPPSAALYTSFQQAPPAEVMEALKDEVDAIMGPFGIHFEWRSLDAVRGNEISSELAVIKFIGRCDVEKLMSRATNPGALGWTHVSDGIILPFSDIDCDRIRVFLQRELLFIRIEDRNEAFGRAVARVLAHELYHIFAQTAHHGSDGVAKSAYTVQELMSDEFQFEERQGMAMHGSVKRPGAAEKPVGTP